MTAWPDRPLVSGGCLEFLLLFLLVVLRCGERRWERKEVGEKGVAVVVFICWISSRGGLVQVDSTLKSDC